LATIKVNEEMGEGKEVDIGVSKYPKGANFWEEIAPSRDFGKM